MVGSVDYRLEQQVEDCRSIARLAIEMGCEHLRERGMCSGRENERLRKQLADAGLEVEGEAES